MAGKKLLKRLVFGRLVAMPAELPRTASKMPAMKRLPLSQPDLEHKVIYAHAALRGPNGAP
jgi:hypothetical protein